jgi:ABC-type branched-subunit amino acid transport system ATPase component
VEQPVLEITDLSVTYNGVVEAVRGVSFAVPRGACVAMLGSNGAGKTTVLRAVSGNLARHRAEVVAGRVVVEGQDLAGSSMSDVVAAGVVQVPEGRRILGRLTVEENLRIGGIRRGRRSWVSSRDRVFALFPRLAERRQQLGLLLSGGEQQMLAIGRALMAGPQLLMLDEPSLGLAPQVVEQVAGVIAQINREGTSVLLVEQNTAMAFSVATSAVVLELGAVSLAGPTAELAGTDTVKELYLGHAGRDSAPAGGPAVQPLAPWRGSAPAGRWAW